MSDTVLHTLSVLVENKAGVLARVSNLFARRGYNIYSLAVAPTDDPSLSRITVVVDVEPALLEQVVKQLHKLINVIKISELDPRDSVERELMLLTVRAEPSRRHQIIELADVFGAGSRTWATTRSRSRWPTCPSASTTSPSCWPPTGWCRSSAPVAWHCPSWSAPRPSASASPADRRATG
jgi:acetolactate synthase small subunit